MSWVYSLWSSENSFAIPGSQYCASDYTIHWKNWAWALLTYNLILMRMSWFQNCQRRWEHDAFLHPTETQFHSKETDWTGYKCQMSKQLGLRLGRRLRWRHAFSLLSAADRYNNYLPRRPVGGSDRRSSPYCRRSDRTTPMSLMMTVTITKCGGG